MMAEEKQKLTLGDLKSFLNSLHDDKLTQDINIAFEDEPIRQIENYEVFEEDVYYNIDNHEDIGTISELKDIHGEDFDLKNYKVGTPKGTVLFY
jgi:hypothetical protein